MTIEGVGNYEVIASQGGNESFNSALDVSQRFTVSKASLTATADDQTINEGEDIPLLTISYSGFKLSDEITILDTQPSIETAATAESESGTYPITLTGGTDDVYEFVLVDGSLIILQVLGFKNDPAFQVFPNPAMHEVKISGSDLGSVFITNLNGQLIKETTQSTIDISDLANGVYLLSVKDRKGKEVNRTKLIKR